MHFFGHRDCPETIKPRLREVVEDLVVNQGVEMFYVGHLGQFDAIVRSVLRELTAEYPQTHYAVVLAYMPGMRNEYDDYSDTMLPEGIESVHPHYAISWPIIGCSGSQNMLLPISLVLGAELCSILKKQSSKENVLLMWKVIY